VTCTIPVIGYCMVVVVEDLLVGKGALLNICTLCKIVTYPNHHLLLFLLFISLECIISYICFCLYECYIKCAFKCIIL
jgi:hypothetical protein